jgi:hypothetical protein
VSLPVALLMDALQSVIEYHVVTSSFER